MPEDSITQRRAKLAARRAALSPEATHLFEQRLQGLSAEGTQAAIPRITDHDDLPLSLAQQRLWFLEQLAPDNTAYYIPQAVRLIGTVNISAFERSLNEIVRRHEVLRTTFILKGEQPVQHIAPELALPLTVLDLTALTPPDRETQLRELIRAEAVRLFDLTRGPLLRVTLFKLADQEHVLSIVMHHIISDGWSIGVFVREAMTIYAAFCAGQPALLPGLPIQYADYAVWQRQHLSGELLEQQIAYWQKQFGGELPTLDLPIDHPRPPVQTFRGAKHTFNITPEVTTALRTLSKDAEATLFMTLLAAFQTLLYRYTGQADLIIGTPIANRAHEETEGLIGFFVNTLALRVDLQGQPTFRELLTRVREVTLGAYAHQDLPFDRLVDELHLDRDLSRTPLFQVVFALQNAPMPAIDLPGLLLQPLDVDNQAAHFDLVLYMTEVADSLIGQFEYNTDLFEAATIQRLTAHLLILLDSIIQQPTARLADLTLLTEAEQQQELIVWNATAAAYARNQCVHELLEAQALRTPDAVAVVFEDQYLTYHELDRRANQLGHHLRELGVGPEVLVGVCLERSLEMVIGLLGILKAGGAYVPLDPAYPPERLAFMLHDSAAAVLVTQSRLTESYFSTSASYRIVCLDTDREAIARHTHASLDSEVSADHLAYVIYTSGSTGQPKGVSIEQGSLLNLVKWHQRAFAVSDQDRSTQLAGLSFDASVWEIWPYLTAGASLHLLNEETRLSPVLLQAWLIDHSITIGFLPTPLAEGVLIQSWPETVALRLLLTGGDKLRIYPPPNLPFRLVNNYGPTENTVVTTAGEIEPRSASALAPTIGRPIANVQVYVLDAQLDPVPIGLPGELYIGGASLARGYLHRPDLTAERFIPNPFCTERGARVYRTGDIVRYRPDGQIEFLGRRDQQVKVRGFRIELGEIESRLIQHPALQQALVIVHEESDGNKQLVAYVVSTMQPPVTTSELQQFLRTMLPEYMIPTVFVVLPELPLTPNGKIDRRALPAPDQAAVAQETYVAPRTPIEKELVILWADVLHREHIGIHDNFFAVGGHSLLATQLITRITQRFQITLPLQALFQSPTIAAIAEKIEMVRWAAQDQAKLAVSDQSGREEGEL